MTVTKTNIESSTCPNCKESITVPKSTRSFICRHCDAIIKVIQKDTDIELKVVGKSVEDDPTYQAIEAQVQDLRAELAEMHKRYEEFMAIDVGNIGGRSFMLAVVVCIGGLVALFWSPAVAGTIVVISLLVGVVGWAIHRSRKLRKLAVATEMSETMAKIGAARDLLQRKAARLKTAV